MIPYHMSDATIEKYQLSSCAVTVCEEAGVDPNDDFKNLLSGAITEDELLQECLEAADEDRRDSWREYVDTMARQVEKFEEENTSYYITVFSPDGSIEKNFSAAKAEKANDICRSENNFGQKVVLVTVTAPGVVSIKTFENKEGK